MWEETLRGVRKLEGNDKQEEGAEVMARHRPSLPSSFPPFLPPSLPPQVHSKASLRERLSLLQDRLWIGWGTARVAVGMSVTASIYDRCLATQEAVAAREREEEGQGVPMV